MFIDASKLYFFKLYYPLIGLARPLFLVCKYLRGTNSQFCEFPQANLRLSRRSFKDHNLFTIIYQRREITRLQTLWCRLVLCCETKSPSTETEKQRQWPIIFDFLKRKKLSYMSNTFSNQITVTYKRRNYWKREYSFSRKRIFPS